MKKLYVSFIAVMAAGAFHAQVKSINAPRLDKKASFEVGSSVAHKHSSAVKSTVIWSNDFSNPNDWATANAGAPDHTSGDWTITTNLNSAQSNPPQSQIASLVPAGHTSASNGYAIINSDAEGGTGLQNAWIYFASNIDLTTQPNVALTFQQTHRRYAESTYVIYSTNGGTTWQEIEVNGDMTTNTNTTNPDTYQLNLSSQIGGQDSVRIGFKYIGNFDWFWAVDDVKLVTPEDYDLEMTNLYWGSTGFWGARLPYYQIATDQITAIDFGGIVSNIGSLDQNDITFTASLTGGAYTGSSTPSTIVAGTYDTLEVTAALTPPTTSATHTVNLAATSAATDAAPANNTINNFTSFSVNPYIYARDKGTIVGGSYNAGDGFEVGNIFDIFSNTSIGGGNVVINAAAEVGTEMFLKLYTIDPATGDFIYADESNPYILTANDLGEEVTLAFIGGSYPLTAGESYLLVAGSFGDGGATNDLVVGTSGTSEAQTTFYFDMTDNTWYYTTSTPMVRMNFDPTLGLKEANNTFGIEVAPNPATDATSVTFTVKNTSDAIITVIDMAGKVVATQTLSGVNGTQAVEINTSALNSGMYTVNVTANGTSVSQKLAVRK
jgi:Secretion system C-terminal sorting domain